MNDDFVEVRIEYPDGTVVEYTISKGVTDMIIEIMEQE